MYTGLVGILIFIISPGLTSRPLQRSWTLQPNVLVVEGDGGSPGTRVDVRLRCMEQFCHQEVLWRRNGEEVAMRGNEISITVVEREGGNYSCYSDQGAWLNYTLVLVHWRYRKILQDSPHTGYMHCSAQNYTGVFQCSWTWHHTRKGTLLKFNVKRCVRSLTGGNISCSVDASGHAIFCKDHGHCPYAEEAEHINLTLYVRSQFLLESYTRRFYIGDIVKPDPVSIQRVDNRTLGWTYPHTWNTPSSYFPLTFQVKEVACTTQRQCTCESTNPPEHKVQSTKNTCDQDVKYKMDFETLKCVALCVRARDAFCDSLWSDWKKTKWKKTAKENHQMLSFR
uniref:Interleukin-12 subunit beta n=1 Tax=Denticeps clupeoides TaxID=299321 RepID=A0AAY4E819_9TELE